MADDKKVSIDDATILERIQPDIDKARNIQDELAEQREKYYNAFRGTLYGNERDGWSKSVAPIIWTNHQSNLSSLTEIFSDEFFTLKGDDSDRANKFQKLVRYQMFRKQDGYRRLYDFLFNAGIYHYAVFKVYHKEDYFIRSEQFDVLTAEQMLELVQQPNTTVTKYDEVEGADGVTAYEKVKVAIKEVTYAGPCFEVIPAWEFFYSADAKVTDWGGVDGRLFYHQVKRSLNEIRKRERAGIYRKGTAKACEAKGGDSVGPEAVDERAVKYDADDLSQEPTDSNSDEKLAKEYTVRECYCKLDLDGDGLLEPAIVVLIEDDIVAQVSENPYQRPPFRVGGMLPEPHKVHGISPPAILDNEQKVMTNLLRFIQDTAAMSTYRNVITNDQRMQQMLQNRKPFDVILGDPTKIGEVPVQSADPFILKAWELMKGENEERTGSSRYNQGVDGDSLNKTATGISLISQASARRLRMSAKLIGNGPLTGLIRDFIFINQKWRGEDPIKLLGTDIQINPQDLDGEYDIEIDIGVSPAEKQASANQMDLLVQFATQAGIPMGIMTPWHVKQAQKKKYSLLNINVDDCMVTDAQFKANEEAKKQQPPQEDWKEFVQVDKLYPSLARTEQVQILMKMGIQPDMQAQAAGIPSASELLQIQAKQREGQIKMAEGAQKMGFEREKHGMDMEKKRLDMQAGILSQTVRMANGAGASGEAGKAA